MAPAVRLHPLLVIVALSGCHLVFPFQNEEKATGDDSIVARSDGSTVDDGAPDGALPDTRSQEATLPDTSLPDAPLGDLPQPDAAQPDTFVPDAPQPDTLLPDAPLPDAPPPDSPLPDSPLPDSPLPDSPLPDSPLPDSPLPDSPLPPDAPPPDSPPTTGTVVVTEIMVSPNTYAGTGEWFELHNPGNTAVNLKGWKLQDKESASQKTPHVIQGDLVINGGQYIVLGVWEATVKLNYTYRYNTNCMTQICFPDNEADYIEILEPNGKSVDKVAYDFKGQSNWPIVTGASMSLKPGATDSSKWSSWCAETQVISGDPENNKGTPGAAAGCQ